MKIRSIATAIVGFAVPAVINAQVIITEIMYDLEGTDTGREWIEVKNTGSAPIDLSTWKFFEANVNHGISALSESEIPSGGFAIIADVPDKFKADHAGYSGLIFDSSFSLSNAGESLVIKDPGGASIDSVSYVPSLGAVGDGKTLQKISSGWIAATPTPGADSASSASSGDASTTTEGIENTAKGLSSEGAAGYSSHSSQSVANVSYDEPELVVTSGRPRLGYAGVPLSFEAKVKSMKNILPSVGVGSVWSFGDGTYASGQFVSHSYEFPGEYMVVLNSSAGGADAVSKVRVKVVEPKVVLRSVVADYVEVANLDGLELNLGSWAIETNGARFVIPEDTIVPPRSSVKFPSKVTKIGEIQGFVRVAGPSGKIFATAPAPGAPAFEAREMKKETAIILPEGMSESALRERLVTALHGSAGKRQERVRSETVAEASPSAEEPAPSRLAEREVGASSSVSAAVIYTIIDRPEKGWWGKIKSVFNK